MGRRLWPVALLFALLSCGDNVHHGASALIVSPQVGLFTDEGGTAATFTVALAAAPSERTYVTVTSMAPDEGEASPRTLVFDPTTYATPQTVTITGVDDHRADGNVAYTVRVEADTGSTDVDVTNGDDDSVGATLTPVSGLMTSEGGMQATFTVALTSEPVLDVVIPIASADPTEGTASTAALTFTPANWSVPQPVTVLGIDDAIQDGDITYAIALGAATSSDAGYNGFDPDDVQLINVDNETTGIVVTPTSGLAVSEAATTATFSVVLQTQPTATVTIPVTSGDLTEATVSAASVMFTTANWNVPKVITVTGVNDALDDGDQAFTIVLGAAVSTDTTYSGVNPPDVTGVNADNDGAGVTVTPTSGLVVTEGATTATFMVVLQSQPTANVTISVMSSDIGEATVSSSSLVFTMANWNVAKLVTVTGVDDATDDGDQPFTIVLGAATSTDSAYSGMNPADVTGTNLDNDGPPGFIVTPTSGLTVSESLTTNSFSVALQAQPSANVTISVMSSDVTEVTVTTTSLTFTPGNWSTAQVVTVTGVNDSLDDGDVAWTIVLGAATSTDSNYSGVNPTDVMGTTLDNDTAGFTVTPTSGLMTTEAAGTALFTVRLTSQPTATVTIGLTSSDTTEGTVSPMSLSFDGSDWSTPKTVTITGVDDTTIDGPQGYMIVLAAATSSDTVYMGLNPTDVSVTNADNDSAGFLIDTSPLVVSEIRDSDAFFISLTTAPTANVTIAVSSTDTTEGTVAPTSLTFTTMNWNVPQQVTLTGVDDTVADGDINFMVVTAAAVSTDPKYSGLNPPDVAATNKDDDKLPVEVKITGQLVVTENATSITYKMRLPQAPSANVTCTMFSFDLTEATVSPMTLTFTPQNFGYQTVTVTGVDDAVKDGDIFVTIVNSLCTSTDPAYSGANPPDVIVQNKDND